MSFADEHLDAAGLARIDSLKARRAKQVDEPPGVELILDEIASRAREAEDSIRRGDPSGQSVLFALWGIGDWIANGGKPLRVRSPEEVHATRRPRVWYESRWQG